MERGRPEPQPTGLDLVGDDDDGWASGGRAWGTGRESRTRSSTEASGLGGRQSFPGHRLAGWTPTKSDAHEPPTRQLRRLAAAGGATWELASVQAALSRAVEARLSVPIKHPFWSSFWAYLPCKTRRRDRPHNRPRTGRTAHQLIVIGNNAIARSFNLWVYFFFFFFSFFPFFSPSFPT